MKYIISDPQRRRLLEVAHEYRSRGYEVITEPETEELPEFLAPFQPDMIARNNQEAVVFEIETRETLGTSVELEPLAQAVHEQTGWRFELVVTNARGQKAIADTYARLLHPSQVRYRIAQVHQLVAQEYNEAAFLLAWSAAEAVLRQLADHEGFAWVSDESESLMKHLFVYGLIDNQQYETLQQGAQLRSSLMHGYQGPASVTPILEQLLYVIDEVAREMRNVQCEG